MNTSPDSDWDPDPQLLAAYFDGELEGRSGLTDVRSRIEAWLDCHPDVRVEMGNHQRLRKLWQATSPPEPSRDTWSKVLQGIDERRRRPVVPPRRKPWLIAGACAGIMLLGATFFSGMGERGTQQTKQDPLANTLPTRPQPVPSPEWEVLPVATDGEVVILRVDGADIGSLVVGELPLYGPLELAHPDEIRIFHVRPDSGNGMRPQVRQAGSSPPMIWARADTEND